MITFQSCNVQDPLEVRIRAHIFQEVTSAGMRGSSKGIFEFWLNKQRQVKGIPLYKTLLNSLTLGKATFHSALACTEPDTGGLWFCLKTPRENVFSKLGKKNWQSTVTCQGMTELNVLLWDRRVCVVDIAQNSTGQFCPGIHILGA